MTSKTHFWTLRVRTSCYYGFVYALATFWTDPGRLGHPYTKFQFLSQIPVCGAHSWWRALFVDSSLFSSFCLACLFGTNFLLAGRIRASFWRRNVPIWGECWLVEADPTAECCERMLVNYACNPAANISRKLAVAKLLSLLPPWSFGEFPKCLWLL